MILVNDTEFIDKVLSYNANKNELDVWDKASEHKDNKLMKIYKYIKIFFNCLLLTDLVPYTVSKLAWHIYSRKVPKEYKLRHSNIMVDNVIGDYIVDSRNNVYLLCVETDYKFDGMPEFTTQMKFDI